MAVRIRMKKMGRKHQPFYRICAMDGRVPRDGKVIEELGYYDPLVKETDARAILKGERIDYWLSVGAQPSEKVRVLIKKYGANGNAPGAAEIGVGTGETEQADGSAAARRAAAKARRAGGAGSSGCGRASGCRGASGPGPGRGCGRDVGRLVASGKIKSPFAPRKGLLSRSERRQYARATARGVAIETCGSTC